jgi:TetR/AcrR family transcriptional regulator, transcriptional repressor for nem operon
MARTKDFDEDEILDKALAIFWHKGYNGVSMQELVDGLGISRSSLYDTFTDKYSLFIKSLQRYRQKTASQVIQMINQAASPKAALKELFQSTVNEAIADKKQRGCFMANCAIENSPHDKAIAKMVHENMQDLEDAFCLAISKGQEMGELTSRQNPRALARFFINSIHGIHIATKSGADKATFDDIVKVTFSVLE